MVAAASPPTRTGGPPSSPPPERGGPGGGSRLAQTQPTTQEQKAWTIAAAVTDPEIPVLTIEDLGVLRTVTEIDGAIEVTITPTYSGCPAMNMIALEIELALERANIPSHVKTTLSPAWTTDWLTQAGRQKLLEYGIAPPTKTASRRALFSSEPAACPRCNSTDTECIAEFGSTSCKALWRCLACQEPFDQFKCH